MSLRDALLPEFDHEAANTRKTLERIPADKLDWKPHEKSMTFEGLATHLANMPRWMVMTVHEDKFDIAPEGEDPTREEPVGSVKKALGMFDQNVADARAAIVAAEDERLLAPWSACRPGWPCWPAPSPARWGVCGRWLPGRAACPTIAPNRRGSC